MMCFGIFQEGLAERNMVGKEIVVLLVLEGNERAADIECARQRRGVPENP